MIMLKKLAILQGILLVLLGAAIVMLGLAIYTAVNSADDPAHYNNARFVNAQIAKEVHVL